MKPQDLLIALKISANTGIYLRQIDLAYSLNLSTSAISRSLSRLIKCKIYLKQSNSIDSVRLMEFIEHAAPFILEINRTGPSAGEPLFNLKYCNRNRFQNPLSWGWDGGTGPKDVHGYAPFHRMVPSACRKDARLRRLVVLFERTLIAEGAERDHSLVELYALLDRYTGDLRSIEASKVDTTTARSERIFRSRILKNEPIEEVRNDAFHR